jgi:hypothetical protein
MSQNLWGYDTASDARLTLPGVSIDDFVTQNRAPAGFVGRYLCDIPGLSNGLSTTELTYLWFKGRAVGPVYNKTSAELLAGDEATGRAMAQDAINLAYALNIPPGVAVWLDIEAGMDPTGDCLFGWMDTLDKALLIGGVYMNTNQDSHVNAYLNARARGGRSLIWSSEPEPTDLYDVVYTTFSPSTVKLGKLGADVVIWQYSENSWRQFNGGLVDFDLVNPRGQAYLWRSISRNPLEAKALGALKQEPNHACRPAIGPKFEPVSLKPGDRVIPIGPVRGVVTNGEPWLEVRLPAPSPVHGWFLAHALQAAL